MRGSRKFLVVILYVLSVTFIAFAVVFWKYDTLAGVGAYALGMATGVGAFMWGNREEHKAKSGETPQ